MANILLVEDESNLLKTLQLILTIEGYSVEIAESGEIALQIILDKLEQGDEFDIIATDIAMPGMSGVELIGRLNKIGIGSDIVVMTGFGEKDLIVELLHKGCSGYIDKPFLEDAFVYEINTVLEQRERKLKQKELVIDPYETRYMDLIDQVQNAKKTYEDITKCEIKNVPALLEYRKKPFEEMGGDSLYVAPMGDSIALFIADVSGHDLSSTYHSIFLKAFFDEFCRNSNESPEEFLTLLNRSLLKVGMQRLITAQFCCWNLQRKEFMFQSAGHPEAFHYKHTNDTISKLGSADTVLGIFKDLTFSIKKGEFDIGDRFYFYTDGFPDLTRIHGETGNKEQLGQSGIRKFIESSSSMDLKSNIDWIWDEAFKFSRQKSVDDVMLVGIDFGGKNV